MKYWILAAATVLLTQGLEARGHWGPPEACPQPKAECKPKCVPQKVKPKPCKPACCPEPEPCCPPVCFERGHETSPCCTPSAYSEPASFDLRCGADVFITASFLYWEAMQGGMDLAVPGSGTVAAGVLTASSIRQSASGDSVLMQGFEYKPGFQVGLGWGGMQDDWVLYAQYTWLHGTSSSSGNAPTPDPLTVGGVVLPSTGLWLPTSWLPEVFVNNATTHISSSWNYKIDLVDAQISRPFYSGARYTVEPFFGLRGAWIRQHMRIHATNVPTTLVATPATEREARYNSRSAAVGPRIGMNGNWFLGYGARFIGNAAASLLFTDYDIGQNVASPDGDVGNPFALKTKMHDVNYLRPNLDLSLGLGWGSYFFCRRMHLDVAATYDFSIFWEQNMMRALADLTASAVSRIDGAASNLYLQGLTIKTRFDF